jgi:UDP-N-acetylglucosamine--N-acetylmuramyl-(pentapeptide) pyrophosphoryl-undecaprenol N-acetylglucosamine transferase
MSAAPNETVSIMTSGAGSTRRVLLVASQGGHLAQLLALAEADDDYAITLATSDGPQLCAVPIDWTLRDAAHVPPRDATALLRSLRPAWQTVRGSKAGTVISTGAGIALVYIPVAALLGKRAIYVESAARRRSPSLTGRLLRRVPRVICVAQYADWPRPWRYVGNVFESFRPEPVSDPTEPKSFLVLLGTQERFQATRLVAGVRRSLPPDAEIVWQLGGTVLRSGDLPGEVRASIPADELSSLVRKVDVVVSHGGVGSALTCLREGKIPVLLPRRSARGEHIDDHQLQICEHLSGLGLAISRDADDLSYEDLRRAASQRAVISRGPLTVASLVAHG